MTDKKISQLTASSTPLAGTEVLAIVQGGVTKKVAVDDLTAGKTVSMANAKSNNYLNSTQDTGFIFSGGVTQNYVGGVNTLNFNSNGVAPLAGKGIDFSAVTNPNATNEVLSDYAEGTWTPVFSGFTFGGTQTIVEAKYTKIGRQVTLRLVMSDSVSISASVGGSTITGLPYNSATEAVGVFSNGYTLASYGNIMAATNIIFVPTFTAGANQNITMTITYFV